VRLYEFEPDNPLRVKLTSIVSQLRSRLEDTGAKKPFSTDALLDMLRDQDIEVSKDDLFDMVKEPPLKNIIKNVSGNEVTFKGQHDTDKKSSNSDGDEDDKTIEKMAHNANDLT
jgi:hypothetical protein